MDYYQLNSNFAFSFTTISLIILILSLILNSALGDYYKALAFLRKKITSNMFSMELVLIFALSLIVLFATRSFSAITVFWAGYSIIRGLNMLFYVVFKRKAFKEYSNVSIKKLKIFSVIIILIAAYLMSATLSLSSYYHSSMGSVESIQTYNEEHFKDTIIILTAQARILKDENIKLGDYHKGSIDQKVKMSLETKYKGLTESMDSITRAVHYSGIKFVFKDYGFEAYLLPVGKTPIFPLNQMILKPSYYADETFKVRSITVKSNKIKCPSDAEITITGYGTLDEKKINFEINEEEIENMILFLKTGKEQKSTETE